MVARKITGARWSGPRFFGLRQPPTVYIRRESEPWLGLIKPRSGLTFRCAIYTRKSSDEGLEQEFNSLDAQREACEAYIVSRRRA